jgi:hypothetical protein
VTPTPDPRRARLQELLSLEAIQGLTPAEAEELDTLLALFPDEERDAFELAAAAVHLALVKKKEKLPSALAEKLHLTAVGFTPTASPKSAKPTGKRSALMTWAGWAVAASLAGVLVYTNWPQPEGGKVIPDLASLDYRPILKERGAVEFAGEKNRVSGNIVWSDKEQVGYLEVKGLPPIAAAAGTYQLWIVDAKREGSPPIDGGVFTVKPDGTALVPIRNPILVKNAAAFAITSEEPGGVVETKKKPEQWELILTKKS